MKKTILLLSAFVFFLTIISCSSDDSGNEQITNPITEEPGNGQETPENDDDNDDENDDIDDINSLYLGDWEIINKKEFSSTGDLLDDREHTHRCDVTPDLYRILGNGNAYEYRFLHNCELSINEEFTVVKENEKVFLRNNYLNYEIIFVSDSNLELKLEHDNPEQNNGIAYFIIYLKK